MGVRSVSTLFLEFTVISGSLMAQKPANLSMPAIGQSTVEMRGQATSKLNTANLKLEKVIGTLKSLLDSPFEVAKLNASQVAWEKYREATAEFESAIFEGGSIQPQYYTGVMTRITMSRIKELQRIVDREQGLNRILGSGPSH